MFDGLKSIHIWIGKIIHISYNIMCADYPDKKNCPCSKFVHYLEAMITCPVSGKGNIIWEEVYFYHWILPGQLFMVMLANPMGHSVKEHVFKTVSLFSCSQECPNWLKIGINGPYVYTDWFRMKKYSQHSVDCWI